MQKVVIDTNVMISALLTRGYPYYIVYELFIEQKIKLCISDDLMQEYFEVINRPKFSKYHDFLTKAESLLTDVEAKATKFYPQIKLHLILDIDDNKLLELADESAADFLITGNTNDFTMPTYKNTQIITPKEYWESYSK
jgi:putative PIN family toxin of toxin-antitoxin system